ncbi:MAG: PAS domain-containing sensor histidine kinase [Maricaulaceae bacterium]
MRWTKAPEALSSNAFAAGFVVAALVLVGVTAQIFNDGPNALAGRGPIILGLNLLLIAGLGGYLALRVWRLARGRGAGDPAPRLHLRFVGLFSLVALMPAVIVGVLLGAVFTVGVDNWFSESTRATIEDAATVLRLSVDTDAEETAGQAFPMANDLNDEAETFRNSPIEFSRMLEQQARIRGFLAAYVIDGEGTILARFEDADYAYVAPSPDLFDDAEDGGVVVREDFANNGMYALAELDAYDDAYLYVARALAPGMLDYLQQAYEQVQLNRLAQQNRGSLQILWGLLYVEMTLLVLTGAVWFGLAAANQVVGPVGRLVEGAERVRDGDLSARVSVSSRQDELTALSQAFNEMTGQLESQRSELVKAAREAETRREFTEAVLSGVSAGVIGVRANDGVSLANRSALGLLGADGENDVVGENVLTVAPELAPLVRQARSSPGNAAEGQADLARDGVVRRLNVRAAAARDGSGAVVVTFDDITQLVSEQRNAAWRDVARRIAHEIKNPLTPIQLSAERLRRKYLDSIEGDKEVFERCVDTIVRQVSDIGRMVDEFSSFARMPEPRPERVEMGELVRSAAFTQRVASPSIEIEIETPGEPIWVRCDERLIAQALTNVLKNSAESVTARSDQEPGAKGSPGRMGVRLDVEDGCAVVAVVDDGLGWPEGPREQLSEPYMTTREKGTGLGLAIVRRVMEDHQGRLELADREDGERGALVRLVLPLEHQQDDGAERGPADESGIGGRVAGANA